MSKKGNPTQPTSRADKGRLTAPVSTNAPAVILVEPQLAENIGSAARAMMNTGLSDLRLVDPKEDWLSDRALAMATNGEKVLRQARRFDTVEAAIADLECVYATTARRRGMVKPVMTARAAADDMRARSADGRKIGIMFGRERVGLTNPEVALANTVVEVPLNPEHSSLNLGQAVLLVGYEWFQAGYAGPGVVMSYNHTRPAANEDMVGLFEHLEKELVNCGFLRNDDMRAVMVTNIRTMLQRAELTEQEVRTFHGIIKELRYGRRDDRPKRQPGYREDDV